MNEVLAVAIGAVFGVLASVPVAMVIAASTQPRKIERSASVQRIDAELITDERIAISKDGYLTSVKALGDMMASPDPSTRHVAALAYDAFRDAVKPS